MLTELQQNFKTIAIRMRQKYKEKEDLFHYLPCTVPAWEPYIYEIIELVEEWNENCYRGHDLRIFQMKEKFGLLVVYLEPMNGDGVVNVPDSIRQQVRKITNRANKICKKCGAQKVETVHESRIQYRCLENYCNDTQWRIREC